MVVDQFHVIEPSEFEVGLITKFEPSMVASMRVTSAVMTPLFTPMLLTLERAPAETPKLL